MKGFIQYGLLASLTMLFAYGVAVAASSMISSSLTKSAEAFELATRR